MIAANSPIDGAIFHLKQTIQKVEAGEVGHTEVAAFIVDSCNHAIARINNGDVTEPATSHLVERFLAETTELSVTVMRVAMHSLAPGVNWKRTSKRGIAFEWARSQVGMWSRIGSVFQIEDLKRAADPIMAMKNRYRT